MDRAIRDEPTLDRTEWQSAESEVAAEGVQAPVPHGGPASEILQRLLAGLRSGMSYCDAGSIEQMWQNARFVRQTESGIREGGANESNGY